MARYSAFSEQTFRRHFQKAFWWVALNLTILRLRQHRRMHEQEHGGHGQDEHARHDRGEDGLSIKRLVVYFFTAILVGGLVAFVITGGTA